MNLMRRGADPSNHARHRTRQTPAVHAVRRRIIATVLALAVSFTGSVPAVWAQNDVDSLGGVTVTASGTTTSAAAADATDDVIVSAAETLGAQHAQSTQSAAFDGASDDSADADLSATQRYAAQNDGATADSAAQNDSAQNDSAQNDAAQNAEQPRPRIVTAALGGRDFEGQATRTIGGRTYILIGNEQQLRAIGTGKTVVGKVWQIKQKCERVLGCLADSAWTDQGSESLAYAGDADLAAGDKLRNKEFPDHDGLLTTIGATRTKYFVKDADGNRHNVDDATYAAKTGQKYASDASYIVFRDIDVSSDAAAGTTSGAVWTPLMFSGVMLGVVSAAQGTAGSLWDGVGADGVSTADDAVRPVVSNVRVHQTGQLDVSKYTGIGFFGTVSNKLDANDPLRGAVTPAYVSNIELDVVSVTNESTEVRVDQTLVSALVGGLGLVVGDIVSGLLKVLTFGRIDLDGLVENLLTIRKADPSSLAVGSFAGRVIGSVTIDKCRSTNVTVSSVTGMTGGFVGYAQGETQYDLISDALGDIVQLLTNILNIIPGLGLGDLITLLLNGNIIDADALIPVAYHNPTISSSAVKNFTAGTVIGAADKDYAGGFIGVQIGTIVTDSSVTSDNAYAVTGGAYVGGFAGLMRNDVMKGALQEVGVDLIRLSQPQSTAVGSSVHANVTVDAGTYAGGFAGAMADSYAVNDTLDGTIVVKASGTRAPRRSPADSPAWPPWAGCPTSARGTRRTPTCSPA
ncbi:Cell surface protein with gram positive anchor domain [Bifidobacterium sp. DSM 109958]|uniref:Cell surface protein with gram positive anchor domain n=1 Tax=Bifidobacterium moraviense TaxID=2675323 RepID=A0A7Y0F4W8_9BIFI|nr:hypothetical protein [Bifidobacterium sp. DSM 109958]NMN01157.1 Cell surface protein with gram positive anchor domain [Bifidobacterium sp. DSM 109958]